MTRMLRFSGGRISGTVTPPASKSHTHRAFFLAAMSQKDCVIAGPLISQDTESTLGAVAAMGCRIKRGCSNVRISSEGLHAPSGTVNAENSGTTMRLFTGIASMFDSPVTVTGDSSLIKRPMGPLLDALAKLGVKCSSDNGRAPVTVCGPNRGGEVSIRGDVSSQFISALMIVSPMLPNDTVIRIDGTLLSRPYVNVTADMMERFGADVSVNGSVIRVRGGTGYRRTDITVPSDMSAAAFPLVMGALGGSATVMNADLGGKQGDAKIVDILRDAGASVSADGDKVTVSKGELKGTDVNMGDTPDLFPIVAVLLSTASGKSRLYGAPQLRFKESDRIGTTVNMLSALGADITGTDDGCVIRGVKGLKGGKIEHLEDHRILMSAAAASIVCSGDVAMEGSRCYDISYPMFLEHAATLGLGVNDDVLNG